MKTMADLMMNAYLKLLLGVRKRHTMKYAFRDRAVGERVKGNVYELMRDAVNGGVE